MVYAWIISLAASKGSESFFEKKFPFNFDFLQTLDTVYQKLNSEIQKIRKVYKNNMFVLFLGFGLIATLNFCVMGWVFTGIVILLVFDTVQNDFKYDLNKVVTVGFSMFNDLLETVHDLIPKGSKIAKKVN